MQLLNAADGVIVDEHGTPQSKYVDTFTTAQANTEHTSGVIFRLRNARDGSPRPADPVPTEQADQFVMLPDRARLLAEAILAACDDLEGRGHTRQ